jgi:hypothetical protein
MDSDHRANKRESERAWRVKNPAYWLSISEKTQSIVRGTAKGKEVYERGATLPLALLVKHRISRRV